MDKAPKVSIAELVGDSRVPRYACHSCKKTFTALRPNIGRKRFCGPCKKELAKTQSRVKTLVRKAVEGGELPPVKTLTCVDCGGAASEYEHRRYDLPLKVQATCRRCNDKRGQAAA